MDRTTRLVRSRFTALIGLICDLKKPVIFVCGFPTAIGGAKPGSCFSFGAAATSASGLVEAARIFLIAAEVGSQMVEDRFPVLASGGGWLERLGMVSCGGWVAGKLLLHGHIWGRPDFGGVAKVFICC